MLWKNREWSQRRIRKYLSMFSDLWYFKLRCWDETIELCWVNDYSFVEIIHCYNWTIYYRFNNENAHRLTTESLPAEIIVKFKDSEFFSVVRKKQFSNIDFLSYCGGILGLFAGISVLSIFELFYYFTIRVVGDSYKAWKSCKVIPIKSRQRVSKETFQKENTITKVVKTYLLRYFKESSIHGCNYSVDTKRTLFERLI